MVDASPKEKLIVEAYTPPDPGPYPQDQPKQNSVKFTPTQVLLISKSQEQYADMNRAIWLLCKCAGYAHQLLVILDFYLNDEKLVILEFINPYRTIKSYKNAIHHLYAASLCLISESY